MSPPPRWRQWVTSPALKKVWDVLVTVGAVAIFVYQVSFNVAVFLDRPTVFMVSLEPNPTFQLPPLSVCPYPPFDPTKLNKFGISKTNNYLVFEEYYLALEGVSTNVTPAQLWQEASWEFGHVVGSLGLGRESHIYNVSSRVSPIWRRSYSPLGPCLTLHTPAGKSVVSLNLRDRTSAGQCKFVDNDGGLQTYGGVHGDCDKVETQCNSSCGLEDFVYFGLSGYDKLFVYFHGTPVQAMDPSGGPEDILEYSEKLFDGSYVLKELFLGTSLKSEPHLVESSLVKGPCSSKNSYSVGECFRKQYAEEIFNHLGCNPVFSSNFKNSSEQICRSPSKITLMAAKEPFFDYACPRRCKSLKWTHSVDNMFSSDQFSLDVLPTTTDIRREEELESYPMAQLFSDTGGSLGLFLGVSLLTFWEFLLPGVSHCLRRKRNTMSEAKIMAIVSLVKYGGILLLATGTCTHILETSRSFLMQPKLTSVSLRVPSEAESEDSIDILVARRLAMQALDCRPRETSYEECQVTCLLKGAANEIASVVPFVGVEGLPLCQNVGLSLPSYVYVVPSEMLLAATVQDRVGYCQKSCSYFTSSNNTRQTRTLLMVVNKNSYAMDTLQLVCSIGGIVGLYLGYSMFDLVDLGNVLITTQDRRASFGVTRERSSKFHQVLKVVICVGAGALSLWQLHTFLIHHRISSSTNQTPKGNNSDQLALTVCRWPPLSLRHVADQLGLNITERDLLKLPKQQRQPEFMRILKTLPGNWSGSLDELWQRAAWNISDVIEGFLSVLKDQRTLSGFCAYSDICRQMWEPVLTPLNRCFSLNLTVEDTDVGEIILVFPQYLEKKTLLGESPQIYLTVNMASQPPLMADMIAKTAYRRIFVKYNAATYRRLDHQQEGTDEQAQDTSHSLCVHKCLSEGASGHLNCRLPFVTWRPDLSPCSQEQYQDIPAYFKGLEGIGDDWNKLKKSEDVPRTLLGVHDRCYRECRHFQTRFYSLTVDDSLFDSFPTMTVKLDQEEDLVVSEEDHYTVSQLLSDLGGIAGSTAGFSLFFLLKEFIPKLILGQQDK